MARRIPTLETERLIIRELKMEDLEAINAVLNQAIGQQMTNAERQRWLQWTVLGYEMFSKLEMPHYGERAIVLKETKAIIGAVGIVPYRETFHIPTMLQQPPKLACFGPWHPRFSAREWPLKQPAPSSIIYLHKKNSGAS